MPKLGMEPIRKAALVKATIAEIGRAGSLDVTVSQIARQAGMSSALAHHYFGGKEALFLAAMSHVLSLYGAEVRGALKGVRTPEARITAILQASFSPTNFRREVVGAWLNFYVLAQTVPEARRLLGIYQRRLRSNLLVGLRPLAGAQAGELADGLGALIDGLYLREVLKDGPPDGAAAVACARAYLKSHLKEPTP
ncbi:transcriptional regulator BetI [Cereibacter azotoformans]|uniref:HTH-type transcriptional regulator BetI n=1 Tax=Cereibacter azotoformans TaxID=43057 RepID=A0A2T5KBZ4_9RHOB|nr:transcriptional regulator BetI [Cereibacter azotoformans]AXQ94191.1 transcriptional regulator BetI [Cereibacter sphaeroides]MBO4168001.1 transcriptional regulator BetI [Cereibacter azotoformans]PTR19933.1 TetR family transcriptional regulator [Cereibacter azotoformans]UIJ29729.1 transcriptional regulator BetI [Cereibacter azotoformans]